MTTTVPMQKRGALRTRRTDGAPEPVVPAAVEPRRDERVEFAPWDAQGAKLRTDLGRARRGFYAPLREGAPSTTRQTEILNTSVIAAPTDAEGVAIGEDVLSRTIVASDPFTNYRKGVVTSANVVVIGAVGVGKSSLCKTVYVLRPLVLRRRRVVVFDRKDQQGAGEYTELVERFGSTPIQFSLDGKGTVLNLLDPTIARADGMRGMFRLVRTIAETVNGEPLTTLQVQALRVGLRAALDRAEGGRAATVADLVAVLPLAGTSGTGLSGEMRERLHQAGSEVSFMLGALLEEYGGLFDGETSAGVELAKSKLTSFDVSQLPPDSPATAMVVATANTWLLGELREERKLFTNVLAEEGWDLVGGPSGRLWQSNTKLARGLGMSLIVAFHKLADIPKDSPAYAIIQEAQTAHLFAQHRLEDQQRTVEAFNLDPSAGSVLERLPAGQHLFKVGPRPAVHLRHIRSPWEAAMTNTDEAMTEAGR